MSKTVRRLLALASAAIVGATVAAVLPAGADPRGGDDSHGGLTVHSGSGYLALGDSVPFGFREATNAPTPDYSAPATFVGYPEDVAADLSLRLANAACPGETTTSFISGTAPSNGCEGTPASPGYRDRFPLHVSYAGSQLDFAVDYLRHHRQTRLVSLMIGANDGFLCQRTTADHCVSEFPALLQTVAANAATILGRLRQDAHYRGQIVLVNYYSLDYRAPVQVAQSQALNQALDAAAQPYHVSIADGFAAFQTAAAQAAGDTCAAGLLTTLSGGGCGVHPSFAGQAVLAGAVERVVRTA